jgi:hypothetical protein
MKFSVFFWGGGGGDSQKNCHNCLEYEKVLKIFHFNFFLISPNLAKIYLQMITT